MLLRHSLVEPLQMQKAKIASLVDNIKTYFKANQYHSAEKLLLAALENTPQNAALRFWLGKTYYHQNKFPEALAEFNLTLADDPQHAEALICLVATYCDLGRYEDSVEIYAKLAKDFDPSTKLNRLPVLKLKQKHVECGDLYVNLGKITEATQEYQKALLLCKDDHSCRLKLATQCYYQVNVDRALREIATILATAPKHFDALIWSGICFFKKGDLDKASEQWEKARRLDPTDAKVKPLIKMNQ